MLVGIQGKMGAGKTLSMSILATYFAKATKSPLWANYGLTGADRIQTLTDIWKLGNGIFCFDEIWLSADARQWKDNVDMTRWINQTRKKKMVVFYTTQHIRQVEVRIRNGTDVLIFCEKVPEGHWLTFIDWQYRQIGRRYLIENASRFYSLYDTFEVLEPMKKGRNANSLNGTVEGYGSKRRFPKKADEHTCPKCGDWKKEDFETCAKCFFGENSVF